MAGPLSGLRPLAITEEDLSIEKEAAGVKANLILASGPRKIREIGGLGSEGEGDDRRGGHFPGKN